MCIRDRVSTQSTWENVIRLYDSFSVGSAYYLILDLANGGDLDKYFNTIRGRRPFSIEEQEKIIYSILLPIEKMHASKHIHRDICPKNILVFTDPHDKMKIVEVKLSDFGYTRYLSGVSEVTKIGTYMSPEMERDEGVTFGTDIFSIGMLIYFVLTGRNPNEDDTFLNYKKNGGDFPKITFSSPHSTTLFEIMKKMSCARKEKT
eukprot:TRINITY_DN7330_c0_g2_i1.p1 TRINITY_DN7330_c0_g2~~TRINITY_DN7330_c0_g2_i1.p1  ORF type:complete len:217 (-),score=28.71 TRINITY_DN7330_c0_g2_i1:242-853(-)